MDVLDRYLQAVKFWLPKAQKQDIIAELSEDIRSQIDDREAELGREATTAEVEAILVRLGRPVLVAERYLPPEHLIGPVWFPIYVFVLKLVVACYLVPWILVWTGLMIFSPAYRVAHSSAGWIAMVGEFWSGFWVVALLAIGTVTVVFAVLERAERKSKFLQDWDPHRLPAVRDPNRIPRADSVVELVVNTVFCSWWIIAVSSALVFVRPGWSITLAPVWPYFYWGLLLISVASIVMAGVNLFRPRWTRQRAVLRLVLDLSGSGLFCWVTRANLMADLAADNLAPARALVITNAINLWMSRAFPIALAVGLVVLAVDIRRMLRAKRSDPPSTSAMAGNGLKNPAAVR